MSVIPRLMNTDTLAWTVYNPKTTASKDPESPQHGYMTACE